MYRVITTDPTLKVAHFPFGDIVVEFKDRVAVVSDPKLADYLNRNGFFVEEIKEAVTEV